MAKAVRLDKFLADAGKGTRSEVKKFIQKGQVQVNGAPAKKPELKVDPEKDTVILSGETVGVAPEFVYYLLNKPAGCVSATEDRNDRTVMEYVPSDRKGLFPVGRLDKDTEGLLLITDDGMLAHELLAPGKHVDKTYFVRVEGKLTVEKIEKLVEDAVLPELFTMFPQNVNDIKYAYAFCINGCVGMIKCWLTGDSDDTPEHMAYLTHNIVSEAPRNFAARVLNSAQERTTV